MGILELAGRATCAGNRAFKGAVCASSFPRWTTFSVLATIATPLSAEGFTYDGTSTVLSGELGNTAVISRLGPICDLENEPLRRVLVNAAHSFRRRKVIERCGLSRAMNG